MSDKIKEILDKLKDDDWYDELDLTGDKWIELKQTETKQLSDYITNLQQEIKEANESVEWWTNRFKAMQKENENVRKLKERYQLEKEYYKSRIDKAIEYIEKEYQDNIIITDYADNPITTQELYGELLDILKGE